MCRGRWTGWRGGCQSLPSHSHFGFTLSPFVVRVWLNKIVKLFLAHEVNCENVFAFPYSFFPARQLFFSFSSSSFFFVATFAKSFAYLRNWIVYIALMTVKGSKLTTFYGIAQSFSCAANVSYTLSIVVALAQGWKRWLISLLRGDKLMNYRWKGINRFLCWGLSKVPRE